ncbi:RNA polymerase primary sigma factor/RNA polymerase nonessential primary-like sigma factor [Saccharothrix ecbatanensis]|uniref:RNA polymerase sigma factor n=1 Tax=Saccharothrix ecbatanensis TaxID=1105145 RepID=A0A7W9HJY1_9PSEU|nr:sigma-70 family RNA polymerase sigma factor [Saccharothrix ecbatanensis]MBB5803657.1 RNA polymerase primary sigma factor/RNA polymerase nonessential primary-like sigma factor [Saccharothrix ecbatanensis]
MTRAPARRAEPPDGDETQDLVRQYLKQIGATPLLSADDEVALARQIEAGVYAAELLRRDDLPAKRHGELTAVVRDGQAAKDHMVRANLRLVVSIAKKHLHRGMPLLDLIQEGNLGLIHAVEKFDYTKGYKFSTYAVWWIRQSVERGIAMHSRTVRLPVHVVEQLAKLARAERKLRLRLDREPTESELADEAGMTPERVVDLRRVGREAISLDTPVGEDGDTRVGDLIEDTDVLAASDVAEYQGLARELRALIDTLPAREALIVTLRYGLNDGGEGHTLKEVAEHLGLTRERIRQIEKEALAKLRAPERQEPLLAWAG